MTFSPFSRWRLSASYSYLNLKIDPAGQDLNRGLHYDGATPQHQFALSSYLDLPGNFEIDAHFRRLGTLQRLPESPTGEGVPAYSELDVHLSWRASDHLRVSVVGQNLLHREHVEFGTPPGQGVIRRGLYAKAVWEF